MREIRGVDLWSLIDEADAICITTNAVVKENGEAVMGKGVALEAKKRLPHVAEVLGSLLVKKPRLRVHVLGTIFHGNKQFVPSEEFISLRRISTSIVSFQTKNKWWEPSTITLIKESAKELKALADKRYWRSVFLPRPGCGNGGLTWRDVKSTLKKLLDDRFTVVSK